MTRWTLDDVARMRLLSQRLVDPLPTAADVVQHLTCVQGQDYPGSTLSVALRTRGRSLAEVREAYDAGQIVRSWPMRGTLFVVPSADLGWMLALTGEAMVRSTRRRREELGLTDGQLGHAEEVVRAALEAQEQAGEPGLTRAQVLQAWEEAGHEVAGGRGYHTLFHLSARGLLCQGPTEGKDQRFVLTDAWVGRPRRLDRDEALAEWFGRYVTSHGPVPVAGFLWWTKLLRRDVAPVLPAARERLEVIDVDGEEHWVDPEVLASYPARRRATAAPLLLPGFDELVLGYGDRSAVLSRAEEALVVPGGNGVFKPTLVRAGHAVGTWARPTRTGAPVTVTPFAPPLPGPVERALPALTAALPG